MLERATEIIAEELEDGYPVIAQWMINRFRPLGRSDYIRLAEDAALISSEDTAAMSVDIASTVSKGEISLQQAKAFQEVISRHASFKGLKELANLRAKVEKLQYARSVPST